MKVKEDLGGKVMSRTSWCERDAKRTGLECLESRGLSPPVKQM